MTEPHKQDAILEIISIAKRHKIGIKEIEAAFTTIDHKNADKTSGLMQKVFTYLGGIFLFAGVSIFIGTHWEDMNLAGQLLVTLGAGFIAFIIALMSLSQEKFVQASTPLFIISAIFETTGLGVLLDAFSNHQNVHHGIIFISIVMLIQQGLAFIIKKRTVLAFTSIVYLCVMNSAILDMIHVSGTNISIVIGLSLMCFAYSLNKSIHIAISPFVYFIGSICFLAGSFDFLKYSTFEPIYLGITAGFIYLSTVMRSRTLLFVSCLAMLFYIGYYTNKHFLHSIGWVLSLMLVGIIMIGMGSFVFKLDKKIKMG